MKKLSTAILATIFLTAASSGIADADTIDENYDWIIRGRAIIVAPDEGSSTSISGKVTAGDSIVPEFDFTYFWTENIATELILATAPHEMGVVDTALGSLDFGEVWILPPQLTMQYHFSPKDDTFRPYVGAGVGYIWYYGEESGDVANVHYDHGVSYTLQAGADFPIDDTWAFNLDLKKLYHNVDVKVNNGAVTADVDLDPWIFGVGLAYRF